MIPTTEFDPLRESFAADPAPSYSCIRDEGGIAWSDRLSAWVIVGYADCLEILRNPRTFISGPVGSRTLPVHVLSVQLLDPPDHAPIHRLLAAAMNAQDMGALADATCAMTVDTLRARGNDPFDLMEDVRTIALAAACRLAGTDPPASPWFYGISEAIVRGMDSGLNPAAYEPSVSAKTSLASWIRGAMVDARNGGVFRFVAENADDPYGDLIVGSLRVIFHSAFETTSKLAGLVTARIFQEGGFDEFVQHHRATALEELFRYEPPVTAESRTCVEDVEIGGQAIAAGETVIALIGAANRDPHMFSSPDRLDYDRKPNPHMTFGRGPHGCPGSRYATDQVAAFLDSICDNFASLTLQAPPSYKPHATLRGIDKLIVAVGE